MFNPVFDQVRTISHNVNTSLSSVICSGDSSNRKLSARYCGTVYDADSVCESKRNNIAIAAKGEVTTKRFFTARHLAIFMLEHVFKLLEQD